LTPIRIDPIAMLRERGALNSPRRARAAGVRTTDQEELYEP
jgi:hypothetical protein